MKKWILIAVGGFTALGLALVFFLFSALPSRTEIVEKLAPATPTHSSNAASSALAPDASETAPTLTSDSPLPRPATPETPTEKARELKMILSLLEEDPRDVRVCEKLGRAVAEPKSKSENGSEYTFDQIFGEARENALMEAYRMPIRAIFQTREIADLLREMNELDPSIHEKSKAEKDTFFDKVGFYGRVALAGKTLYSNKEHYELLGDRASHLAALARLTSKHPELANHSRIQDFCRSIEETPAELSRDTLRQERSQLLGLMSENGIRPEEIDFKPEEWMRLNVKSDKNGLTFTLHDKDNST